MAEPLGALGCPVWANPFGPLYNPLSVARLLIRAAQKDLAPVPADEEFFNHGGLWRHPEASSRLAHPDRDEAVRRFSQAVGQARQGLMEAEVAVLTLGTAEVWSSRQTGKTWANCHTLPQDQFVRRTAALEEMTQALTEALGLWKALHPELKLILTLSPVRYHKPDGAQASLSKALLRIVCHQVAAASPLVTDYFPAAEILLDELRDYRWYAEDRRHPSDEASLYIAERFWKHYSPYPQAWETARKKAAQDHHRPRFPRP